MERTKLEVMIRTEDDRLTFCNNPCVPPVRVIECDYFQYHSCQMNCDYAKMIQHYAELLNVTNTKRQDEIHEWMMRHSNVDSMEVFA